MAMFAHQISRSFASKADLQAKPAAESLSNLKVDDEPIAAVLPDKGPSRTYDSFPPRFPLFRYFAGKNMHQLRQRSGNRAGIGGITTLPEAPEPVML